LGGFQKKSAESKAAQKFTRKPGGKAGFLQGGKTPDPNTNCPTKGKKKKHYRKRKSLGPSQKNQGDWGEKVILGGDEGIIGIRGGGDHRNLASKKKKWEVEKEKNILKKK